ncbi:peptidoglycan-binding protein [Rosenbergiella sp. S61]|uniref:Peptidoglycan-binding protein n=2 Tax=Rosenbergiella gaditana TaxID=2726987 RepID=A0ABS5SXQ2_9GAMM|nr:peptidoglycan-binding protein [Rosenbergiella gaditana]MBT0724882.1 peptidoglycan-binding protein [Rosenbergiella gaditana]
MMIDAGYNHIHGTHLRASGNCDQETKTAILWYQQLLNMSPTGVIHPMETLFYMMFSQATSPHWRPINTSGPLKVREGQFTFDAEGRDYLTTVEPFRQPAHTAYFSRILHSPGGPSGVTIGRGYDMKMRSSGVIFSDMKKAGVEDYKSLICSKAAGLYGRHATEFVKYYGPLVGEISHLQQVRLFENTFSVYVSTAARIYKKNSPTPSNWDSIDNKIKEIFYDTLYQGNTSAKEMVKAISSNNRSEVVKYIEKHHPGNGTSRDLLRIRYLKK